MSEGQWHDVGKAEELARQPLQQILLGRTKIALSCIEGRFGAVHGATLCQRG